MIPRRDLLARLSFLGLVGGERRRAAAQGSPMQAQGPASTLIQSIDGPLVVTEDLDRQRDLFEGVLGLSLVADQELDALAVRNLFGVTDRTARSILLETKGTAVGVRFVVFRPASDHAVGRSAPPIEAGALKGIAFLVPDLERARTALASRGFHLGASPASYSTLVDGRFTEAHIEGPDGVICTLVQMHDAPLSRYVTVIDRTFSEILGMSAPVLDREAAAAFYRDTLGLKDLSNFEIADESIEKLRDSKERTRLRGAHFGVAAHAPWIGVIDYGLPPSTFRSLRDRSVLPHRGLQALRISVPSVTAVAQAASAAGIQVVAPPAEALLFPQGRVKSILMRAPHGVLHHFTETLGSTSPSSAEGTAPRAPYRRPG